MPRDLTQERARLKDADALVDKLAQVGSACGVIKAKIAELVSLRARVLAGVATGEFDQADVDKLDALTPKVAALNSAVNTYLE